ncbi:exosome complex component CSL4 [Kluyveromyces marxianus]|uniref:Exosome complex component CSL4 n=2 Tax=Kluyveromyces marxianus TaxID=4911 RepID=W0TEN6_KLUMD|nr:exosome complex component CSL4 [Kluyveromyces marxianus DMKU3-1042]QGN16982.1 exosome complex component CSL4 [Kluyveromyces marxianus]BAO41276.1 exosome complex component CSL4 [Kluyveromyces marxianus DMKU3-1042]BAP72723.1 exosome complex component CSL4 [Kluyveromyces marxianus]
MDTALENIPEKAIPGDLICPLFESSNDTNQEIIYRFIPGHGCKTQQFEMNSQRIDAIVATLKGPIVVEPIEKESSSDSQDLLTNGNESETTFSENVPSEIEKEGRIIKQFLVSISNSNMHSSKFTDDQFINNLPREGDVVLARVTRINLQRITVDILAVETTPLPIDSGIGSNGSGITAPGGGSGAATFSISQASADLGETFRGIIRSQDVRATDRDRVKVMESFKPGDIIRAQVLSLGDGTHYYLTTASNQLGVVFAKSFNGAGEQMYAIDWQTMISPHTGITEKRKCAKPF